VVSCVVFQVTSMSAPQVSGALAILASAADQTGRAWVPHSLKRSLELGARPVDGGTRVYQELEVGHGLVQVDKAWTWLTQGGGLMRQERSRACP